MYSAGRTFQDMKSWDKSIGKIYYELSKDEKSFRTIRVAWNPWMSCKVPQTSNWVYGTPPNEMEMASPTLLSSLRRVPQYMPF